MLKSGDMLGQRYRIDRQLGQGGMGAVYRAWDQHLQMAVAVKEMSAVEGIDLISWQQLRQQFQQEAHILARLAHPHLVKVFNFFEEFEQSYLIMELVEGESLNHYIERRGAILERQVVQWGDQLLGALHYCHSQGIIHRDIKPNNILIRPNNSPVLIDFGLVKIWDVQHPATQTFLRGMGTPEYAPPEQYDTYMGHTDVRSDLYSLGATLYYALTGQVPLTATQRIVNPNRFRPIQDLNPQVSYAVSAAIMQALELQPDGRFASAETMRTALHTEVQPPRTSTPLLTHAVLADNASQPQPLRKWGVIGLLVLCLCVGGIGTMALFSQPEPEPHVAPTSMPLVVQVVATDTRPSATKTPFPTEPPPPTDLPTFVPTNTPDRRPFVEIEASYLEQPPVLDGSLDEWVGTKSHSLNYFDSLRGEYHWSGSADLDTTWHFGWDEIHFYIAVQVLDNVHVQEESGSQIWRGDSLEIQWDVLGDGSRELQSDDLHFIFSPGNFNDKSPYTHVFYGTDVEVGESADYVALQVRRTATGYHVECAIPWADIRLNPESLQTMRLGFTVADVDDPDVNYQQTLLVNTSNHIYNNPSTWATFGLR